MPKIIYQISDLKNITQSMTKSPNSSVFNTSNLVNDSTFSKLQQHIRSVLTIGNFDGVHLGHQSVIQSLITQAKTTSAISVLLTFTNHPSHVLRPETPTHPLCSIDHKVHLLSQFDLDYIVLLEFTKEFSEQTAREFLTSIRSLLPFSHLILGYDATIGKNKAGDRIELTHLSTEMNFITEYLDELDVNQVPVSSSTIRKLIKEGNFSSAKNLLGRDYSIYGLVIQGQKHGNRLGFPTANLDVKGLTLPPYGVYAVKICHGAKLLNGIANLGIAPTLRGGTDPVLEVFIFDHVDDLYGEFIDVILVQYIRPEKYFSDVEELKKQIKADIDQAKQIC